MQLILFPQRPMSEDLININVTFSSQKRQYLHQCDCTVFKLSNTWVNIHETWTVICHFWTIQHNIFNFLTPTSVTTIRAVALVKKERWFCHMFLSRNYVR